MLEHIDVGDGEAILFIHGLGSKKEAWTPQLSLAEKYRLIIPDLRGHGETEIDGDITMEDFAADIIELLDIKGIEQIFVCGLSLGGIVAQELFKQQPRLVKGFILANTTSYIIPMFADRVIEEAVLHYHEDSFVDKIVRKGLYNRSFVEKAKEAFLIRDSYPASAEAPLGKNYFPLLTHIKQPVLLLGSSHDKVTPILNMWSMKLFLPHAHIKIFWETGHLSNIEKYEEFNQAIDEFVKGAI